MSPINFELGNLIIFWYPQYSGGKFIMNCLSLSKHAIVLDAESTDYLLNNPEDYDYRFSKIIKTLPPANDMKDWLKFEMSLNKYYGVFRDGDVGIELQAFENLRTGKNINKTVENRLSLIVDKGMSFYSETRGDSAVVTKALNIWPNAKIIMLTNIEKFWQIASSKKNQYHNPGQLRYQTGNEGRSRYELIKGDNWPTWEIFEKYQYNIDKASQYVIISKQVKDEIKMYYQWHTLTAPVFSIDVDNTYFNKEAFLSQMKDLYDWLGYTDFNKDLIAEYYSAYIELHK